MSTPILDVFHLKKLVADGPWAHGGYPKYYVAEDGGVLCHQAVEDNLDLVTEAMTGGSPEDAQWAIAYCEVNWEDPSLMCDHYNVPIPSAYAEEQAGVHRRSNPWHELRNAGLVPD